MKNKDGFEVGQMVRIVLDYTMMSGLRLKRGMVCMIVRKYEFPFYGVLINEKVVLLTNAYFEAL